VLQPVVRSCARSPGALRPDAREVPPPIQPLREGRPHPSRPAQPSLRQMLPALVTRTPGFTTLQHGATRYG
jgi:hypothetical protein